MQHKASFKIFVNCREMLSVGDVSDNTLMLTEMEAEPIKYPPGGVSGGCKLSTLKYNGI